MRPLGIDPQTWRALSQLLDQALEFPESERLSWVENLGPEHAGLKPQLREILSASSAGPLTSPRMALTQPVAPREQSGDCIGLYRLVRALGEGGMGTVWLAERTDGLINRAVALKLPRVPGPGSDFSARFVRERRILATLNHPHIARLYDAGVSESGIPYLALEYVEGRRLDEYCEAHRLGIAARVNLFLQVARAVAHAHARLVVHRDLKPSNILVTAEGEVRLLDFGVAGLLEDGRARPSELTQAAGTALTPPYASPEQLSGDPIGVASDVYALGVVLCELLAGSRPYRLVRDTRAALEEAILHGDPVPPSALAGDAATRRALRGDLDTIVLKALRKKPEERYGTVQAMAEDLERHLAGFPVHARPDGGAYRLARFVRRHRVIVGAVGAVILTILIGASVAVSQAHIARREQRHAEEVKDFVASIFRDANPYEGAVNKPSAQSLLEQAAARIERTFADRPGLEVELLSIVAESLWALGDDKSAEPVLQRARTISREHLAPDDPQALRAQVGWVDFLRRQSREDEMGRELAAVLPLLEGRERELPRVVSVAYRLQSHVAMQSGDMDAAVAAAKRAWDIARSRLEPADVEIISVGQALAQAYFYNRAPELALPVAEETYRFAITSQPGHLDNPGTVTSRIILARTLAAVGRLDEAAQHMAAGIAESRAVFGPDSMRVGITLGSLTQIQLDRGDLDAALAAANDSVRIMAMQQDQGGFFSHASALMARAAVHLERHGPAEVFSDLDAAGAAGLGPRSVRLASLYRLRALVLAGRLDEVAQEVAAIEAAPADRSLAFETPVAIGMARRSLGAADAALLRHQAALSVLTHGVKGQAQRWVALSETGRDLVELSRWPEAIEALEEALRLDMTLHASATPRRADTWLALGRAYRGAGRMDEALEVLRSAAAYWREFSPDHPDAIAAASWLRRCEDEAASRAVGL